MTELSRQRLAPASEIRDLRSKGRVAEEFRPLVFLFLSCDHLRSQDRSRNLCPHSDELFLHLDDQTVFPPHIFFGKLPVL
jgi:hypothetical protein